MKSTKYSKFCTKVFGKIFLKNNKDHIEEKNITLARADIAMEYDIYYSAALMNTIIFSISSLIFVLLLYTFLPVLTLLSVIIIPALVTLCTTVTYLYLPKYLIKKERKKN